MLLTVSKRLEFSASRRLFVRGWSNAENVAAFGEEIAARYGTGRNYVAYFIFSGITDPRNGMLLNISEIKARISELLRGGFDHKFLNEDNAAFADIPPTVEAVAFQLLRRAQPLFDGEGAQLVACHLRETEQLSATAYASGGCETNYWFEFSAARQTMSPNLSPSENHEAFGVAASPFGHGHNYSARLTSTLNHEVDAKSLVRFERVEQCLNSLRSELDHKNLNHEVTALRELPITTESLARYVHSRAGADLPIDRVRLHERNDFFAEHRSDTEMSLGMQRTFSAAHRLHAPSLGEEENAELYGKCNNRKGHGHRYRAEATITGNYDLRTGTVGSFTRLRDGLDRALRPWNDKHLDLEVIEFTELPSTGENIVQALWPKVKAQLGGSLSRLRLWETANNRFALRRV